MRRNIEESKDEDRVLVYEYLSSLRTEENETVLDIAAQENDIETLNKILKKADQCLQLKTLLPFILTPLHRAAEQNNVKVARALLENLTAWQRAKVMNAADGMGKQASAYIPEEGVELKQLLDDYDKAAKSGILNILLLILRSHFVTFIDREIA